MEEQKIEDLNDFIKIVLSFYDFKKENSDSEQLFWFRGENSINFKTPLIPNAFRSYGELLNIKQKDAFCPSSFAELEERLKVEFFRYALPHLNTLRIENTDWNRYYLMQHYNLNTRLLDWSESSLVALFFAITGNTNSDGVVWVIDPYKLNSASLNQTFNKQNNYNFIPSPIKTKKIGKLFNEEDKININQLTTRYLHMKFNTDGSEVKEKLHYYPISIFPCYLDERTRAQKTCFTIFGNRINGLNFISNADSGILNKIIIDKSAKHRILEQLRVIGFDQFSVFPDLDGIGSAIKSKYKNQFQDNSEALFSIIKEKSRELK